MIILGERKMQQVCLEQMHCKRWWVHSCKRNRIGGIFVLHWASWADYIGYIGLTPHVGRQCGIIPIYSNIPRNHSGSAADGETEEEANKLTSPPQSQQSMRRVCLWLEKKPMSPHAKR